MEFERIQTTEGDTLRITYIDEINTTGFPRVGDRVRPGNICRNADAYTNANSNGNTNTMRAWVNFSISALSR